MLERPWISHEKQLERPQLQLAPEEVRPPMHTIGAAVVVVGVVVVVATEVVDAVTVGEVMEEMVVVVEVVVVFAREQTLPNDELPLSTYPANPWQLS